MLTTEEVAKRFQMSSRNEFGHRDPRSKTDVEFYRWLTALKFAVWDAGFSAGEQDIMMHEHSGFDEPCIPNPYREETK